MLIYRFTLGAYTGPILWEFPGRSFYPVGDVHVLFCICIVICLPTEH